MVMSKSTRLKLGFVAALIVFLVFAIVTVFAPGKRKPATADAVRVTFIGFTNAPNDPSHRLFAVFCVSNCAGYSIRWRGAWTEIEGSPEQHAEIVNRSLPRFDGPDFNPVFRAGGSFKFAVGDPFQASEIGRWRFAMAFSRDSFQERWLNFSFRHRWVPLRPGPFVLVNGQGLLNPTNHVIARSEWVE